jgi:hypothetical protein
LSEDTKKRVLEHLSKLEAGARERVILTLRGISEEGSEIPSPDDYATRKDYRKALIEHATSKSLDATQNAISRLKRTGALVWSGPLSTSVIVEGTLEQLAEALDDDDVEAASLDERLDLIEPDKGDPSPCSS